MDKSFLSQIDQINELVGTPDKLADEVLICECFCVDVGDIRELCKEDQVFDLDKVRDHFGLGLGCQSCLKRIDTWINNIFS